MLCADTFVLSHKPFCENALQAVGETESQFGDRQLGGSRPIPATVADGSLCRTLHTAPMHMSRRMPRQCCLRVVNAESPVHSRDMCIGVGGSRPGCGGVLKLATLRVRDAPLWHALPMAASVVHGDLTLPAVTRLSATSVAGQRATGERCRVLVRTGFVEQSRAFRSRACRSRGSRQPASGGHADRHQHDRQLAGR
jgi:hypothetical protein